MADRFDPVEVGMWPRPKRIEQTKVHFSKDWAEAIRMTSAAKTGSGYAAALVINERNPNMVLDLGCGNNVMKQYIPNLIGIDLLPWSGNTDVVMDVIEYLATVQDNSIDAIRCVGPFNFGTDLEVHQLIAEVHRVLSPGGIICCHARPAHRDDSTSFQQRGMIHYPWTRERIRLLTTMFNWKLHDPNPSVPDMKEAIITEVTDMTQVTWEALEQYLERYNPDNSTVDKWNQSIDRSHMLDPTEEPQGFAEVWQICTNEKYRRLKDDRYDPSVSTGVRPRYNWWWEKKPKGN